MAPRTYIVHDGAEAPAADLRTGIAHPLTWKRIFLGLAMTVLTGASGIIGSHVRGVTADELKETVKPLATKEDVKDLIKAAVAAESDSMKKYVDEKTEPSAPAKRPQRKRPQ